MAFDLKDTVEFLTAPRRKYEDLNNQKQPKPSIGKRASEAVEDATGGFIRGAVIGAFVLCDLADHALDLAGNTTQHIKTAATNGAGSVANGIRNAATQVRRVAKGPGL